MATHLVTKTSDFGSLGVPAPASTPLALGHGPQRHKTLIFRRFFKGWSKEVWKHIRFFAIWVPSQASQSQNGEDVSSGIGGQEFSSRIQRIQRIHRIHYFPAEMVSGAAVQTLPNHAQESQDDVSSQADSLKLDLHLHWRGGRGC